MTTSIELPNGQAIEADAGPPDEALALFGFGHTTPVPHNTVTNGDEQLDFGGAKYIGNFHKTLPRRANGTGEVDPRPISRSPTSVIWAGTTSSPRPAPARRS